MTTRSNLWTWRPVRVSGRNRIAVMRGRRVVMLLGPHEVDDAHALVTMRNLAAGAAVSLLGTNGQ